jgi:tRNA (Thr-GGU) A37 N-methylase
MTEPWAWNAIRYRPRIDIEDVDMIDGTSLLDIKPYVPAFDARDDVRIGWYANRLEGLEGGRADDRFR